MKSKKIVSIILLIVMLLSISTISHAADTYTASTTTSAGLTINWSYELDGDNIINLKCTNISAISGKVEIPSTIDGKTVTTIGEEAFYQCYGMTEVSIPDTITYIGSSAFGDCTGLSSVTIPDSVTYIGEAAFANCTGLVSITIPDSVIYLGNNSNYYWEGVFYRCSGLKTVELPKNLTKLGKGLFYGCSGLTYIEIPDKVTTIDYGAFYECALKSIIIPDTVVSIYDMAFYGNSSDFTIYGNEGSYAEEYAEANSIKFDLISNYGKTDSGNDVTAPTVTSIKVTSPTSGTYTTGQKITIQVNFSETITATTMPTLKIKFGTGEERSITTGTLSGSSITYTYTIVSSDKGQLITSSLSGGDVQDAAGNSADLTCPIISGNTIVANSGTTSGNSNTTNSNTTNSNTTNSSTSNSNTTNDTTVATTVLPQTGEKVTILIAIITVISLGIFAYIKTIKYKEI